MKFLRINTERVKLIRDLSDKDYSKHCGKFVINDILQNCLDREVRNSRDVRHVVRNVFDKNDTIKATLPNIYRN